MNLPFVINPGQPFEFTEAGDFFRILSSQAPLDVRFYLRGKEIAEALQVTEGYAERWRGEGFDRLVMTSGTAQTVQFVTRLGADVFFDQSPVGDTAIVSSVPLALDTPTMNGLMRPMAATTSFGNTSAMTNNVPQVVFSPAANVNGAIILTAGASVNNGATGMVDTVLIGKSSPPASIIDGDIYMGTTPTANNGSGVNCAGGQLQHPQFVPAGMGLYFISNGAVVAASGAWRACRYRLL
ncbi:hypothetical protein [uncultured Hydrogenophaga sp.]|uniref:hypothetical protein n=1 Tax=uncultured Hydrogenophaga sp. TaxID=199683 RepID=UPI00265FBBF6|nr:hypothetical protein [uncultured Hydrogenophaga sp.]